MHESGKASRQKLCNVSTTFFQRFDVYSCPHTDMTNRLNIVGRDVTS